MSAIRHSEMVSRRVSVESLLQAARSIASSNEDADFEWAWLRGEIYGSAITARDCLEDVHCDASSQAGCVLVDRFIAALCADGLRLIEALEQERINPRAAAGWAFARLLAEHATDGVACGDSERHAAPDRCTPRTR